MAIPLWVDVKANISNFMAGMSQIQAAVMNTNAQLAKTQVSSAALGQLMQFRNTMVGAAAAVDTLATGMDALFVGMVRAFTSQESAFAGIRKTISATEEEFQAIKGALTDLSNRTPVSFEDLSKIGQLAGQLGVRGVNDLTKFTETVARISVSTNLTVEEAAIAFARLSNVMQEPISNVDKVASAVVALGNNFATTEQEIINFSLRIAGAGKIANLTTADVLGISAALASVGIRSEAGGTAVQKMLTEMTKAVATGSDKLRIFAMLAGETQEQFATGFKTAPAEEFIKVVEGIKRSGDGAFAALEGMVGSEARFLRVFLNLANGGDLLRRAIEKAGIGIKDTSALMNESNRRFETFESLLNTVWHAVQNLAAQFGESLMPLLRPLAHGILDIVVAFQSMPAPLKTLIAVTVAAGAALLTLLGIVTTGAAIWIALSAALVTAGVAAGTFVTSILVVTGVIAAVGAAIIGAITLWGLFSKGSTQAASDNESAWQTIKDAASSAGSYMMDVFGGIWEVAKDVWVGIKDAFITAWDIVKAFAVEMVDFFMGFWNAVVPPDVQEGLKMLGRALLENIVDMFKLVKVVLQPVIDMFEYLRNRGKEAREKATADARETNNEILRENARGASLLLQSQAQNDAKFKLLDETQTKEQMRQIQLRTQAELNGIDFGSSALKAAISTRFIDEDKALNAEEGLIELRKQAYERDYQAKVDLAHRSSGDLKKALDAAKKDQETHDKEIYDAQVILYYKRLAIERDYRFDSEKIMQDWKLAQISAMEDVSAKAMEFRQAARDLGKTDFQNFVTQQQNTMASNISALSKSIEFMDKEAAPGLEDLTAAFGDVGKAIVQATQAAIDLKNANIKDWSEKQLLPIEKDAMGAAAAIGHLGEEAEKLRYAFILEGKSYDELTPKQKEYVDNMAKIADKINVARQAKELATKADQLYMAGMDKEAAIALAAQTQGIETTEKNLQARLNALETYNNAEQKSALLRAQIMEQEGIKEGDYYKAAIGRVRTYIEQQDTLWQGFGKLMISTFDNVQRTLSDSFFDFFTTGTFDLQKAWKNMLNAFLRDLSNFLAQQATRYFLQMLFGDQGGSVNGTTGTINLGGIFGGGGGSGGGGTVNGTTGPIQLGGLVGAGISGIKSLFGFGSSTTSSSSSGGYSGGVTDLFGSGSSYSLGGVSTSFDTSFLSDYGSYGGSSSYSDWGYMSGGGVVPGMGFGDTVPTMLTPGEFVVRREVAQGMEPFLSALNQGGIARISGGRAYMADGGIVPSLSGGNANVLALLAAIYQQATMQTVYGQMTAINTGTTASALGGTAAAATAISGTGINLSPITATSGGSPLSAGGKAASIPNLRANFSPSMIPTPPGGTGFSFNPSGNLGTVSQFALRQLFSPTGAPSGTFLSPSNLSPSQLAAYRTALSTGTFDTSQFIDSGQFSAAQLASFHDALVNGTISPDLGTALLNGDTSGFHLIDTHLNDPTQPSTTPTGSTGSTLGILGAGAGTLGGLLGLFQNAKSGSGLGIALSGITTIASAYSLIQQLVPANTLPSLSEFIGSGIQSAAGSLGLDLSGLTSTTVGAGALAAIQAAIKIAGIAMDDKMSDEDKAIKASEAAVTAVAAAAAPATFGASLAVLSIIDFIERLRAGQSWDKAIVGANDPTALLGITFPNSSEPGISGAISSPSMDWLMFAPHLAENFQKGGLAMNAMVDQLNYVQTKEQLGAVLNGFRNKIQTELGWSWFGSDTPDPYKLPPFPEAGGSKHEGGLTISFGSQLAAIQNMVDQLLLILPGERITSLSYFDRGIPGQLQDAAFYQAHPGDYGGGLSQIQVVSGYSGEAPNFSTEITGNALPVWSPDGSGGIIATQYSALDLMNAIGAGTITGPIYDPRTGQFGYVWAGTTAASLGIPDAASLLSPYYRNFGQSLAPQIGALQALTAPTITSVNAVRPGPGDPGYMDWLMANDPNAYQQILNSFYTGGPDGGGFATGGWVTGGIPGRDSVPKLLMPGEYVIPAAKAANLADRLDGKMIGGPNQITIHITVTGNVDDPHQFAQAIAPILRDELKRIDSRYSRAGNKTEA